MKKRVAALSMAALMTVSACFPAQAVWVNVGPSQEEAIWRHTDSSGEFEKNVLRVSNGKWFWIGSDGFLDTGHEGKEISIYVNGVKYILTLNNMGMALEDCRDEAGNPGNIYEILGVGVSSYVSNSTKANSWWQVKEDGKSVSWKYNDENTKPLGQGLHEIDGELYYFDKDGEMKVNQFGDFIDGYYREAMDYALAANRWIPYKGQWCYCGDDGRRVTGEQEIDGVIYDFGEDGFLTENIISFPLVTSIELGDYPEEAIVGEIVEIPFTINVKQKIQTATSSNAEYEETEADYDMFKSVYAVGNKNRFNLRTGNSDAEANVTSLDNGPMQCQYEIDWDNQVIRVPMLNVGLAYGTMRIVHQYDANGKKISVVDKNGFKIRVSYPDVAGEELVSDVFKRMEEGEINSVEAVDTLKCIDNEELSTTMMGNSDILSQMKALDYLHSEDQNIATYLEVRDEVKEQIDKAAVKVIGLGFSGEKNKKIGLHVAVSKEEMPEELKNMNTAAFDLKVMLAGEEKNDLEIPLIITIPRPKTISGTSFELYHIHDDEVEEVSYLYDTDADGVTFAADRFSTYVFTEEKKTENHGGGSSSSNDSDSDYDYSSDSSSSKKAEKEAEKSGAWTQDAKGWWFRYTDGTYPAGSWKYLAYNLSRAWYHFDSEGYLQTGWFQDIDGRWYYLNPNSDGTLGSMVTGWKQIDGHWYYFNERSDGYQGSMVMNGTTPDGYTVNEQGIWIQ